MKQKLSEVKEFLTRDRIAMVGVSRDEKKFSRHLFNDMVKAGYDLIPVNPGADKIDEYVCFKSVKEIEPKVDTAFLVTNKSEYGKALDECIEAGIKKVWFYGVSGPKEIDKALLQKAADNGIEIIAGFCPYMFMEKAAGFHKFHGFIWKLVGLYPK